MEPPRAPRRPTVLEQHGDRRVDDWYWLRNREDPEVIAYLEAENAYTDEVMGRTRTLQERLYEEFRSRIQETDSTVPARRDDRWYYTRTVEGRSYTIHCRRSRGEDGAEEILLDENQLAGGHEYFKLGVFAVSPDHRLLAYSLDTTGAERYTLRIRDLDTQTDLTDELENTYYSAAWASDNRTLFYVRPDETMRPWQLWRHEVGSASEADVCLHEEEDDRFYLSVSRTRSGGYIVLALRSMITAEARVLDAAAPTGEFRAVQPRRQGVEYSLDHRGDRFLVLTNEGAPNFRLLEVPTEPGSREDTCELEPHRDDVRLLEVEAFSTHIVLSERAEALPRIRVVGPDGDDRVVEQPEPVYSAWPSDNLEFETKSVRYGYSSLTTPPSVFDYDVRTGERVLRKRRPVPNYEPDRYATERSWATAPDGTRVPLSLVYPRTRARDGTGPMMLYGYGSYEVSIDPHFSPFDASLLDRGFALAIAHVRGGGELGRRWYENGKFERKQSTFTDFIACAEHLVAEGWTSKELLVARGGSAGGLLMGAVLNLRPDLFAAVVAEVPFVDCLTTVLDESLPLTVLEWEEWGNPNDPHFYRVLKSYSPYDNVEPKDFPPILVTAGLHDPRVGFWEPAKWVAKLRATKTDSNRLLLKTRMGAGHFGPSGRYDRWREEAFVYAFVLDTLAA